MTDPAVPDEVRRFILTSIPSVPYLEALLLLRSDPSRRWDALHVASRLYIGQNEALELLQGMAQSGVAGGAGDGAFLFSPRTRELARVIDALAATYSRDLVGVTDLIHWDREKPARQFSHAFRWKNDAG